MPSTSLHLSLPLLLALGLAASTVACSASPSDEAAGSTDSDITGVTDLTEMESALGLSKDFKKPDGSWYRGDDKLKAGECYKKLIDGPDGASYQFRRYSTGASFFKKQGAGAASGDERPVVCVDVDIDRWNGTSYDHFSDALNDFEVDSVIRYRLGAPQGSEGAAGHSYKSFIGGAINYVNYWCYGDGPDFKFDPASPAEVARDCMGGMSFPGSVGEIDGAALLTVYQYALSKASQSDRFSSQADAVGRFIKVTGDYQTPEQVIAYEKADLHVVRSGAPTSVKYVLSPHDAPASTALFQCDVESAEDGSARLASCH
jgi:hypothetical protein